MWGFVFINLLMMWLFLVSCWYSSNSSIMSSCEFLVISSTSYPISNGFSVFCDRVEWLLGSNYCWFGSFVVDVVLFYSIFFLCCDIVVTINCGSNMGEVCWDLYIWNCLVDSNFRKNGPLRCFGPMMKKKDEQRVSDVDDEILNFGQHFRQRFDVWCSISRILMNL